MANKAMDLFRRTNVCKEMVEFSVKKYNITNF